MDVLLTYTHLDNLLEAGYIFYFPILSSSGAERLDMVLYPFKTEQEALNFAFKKGLDGKPINLSNLTAKAEISKAIEENRCYIFNQAAR